MKKVDYSPEAMLVIDRISSEVKPTNTEAIRLGRHYSHRRKTFCHLRVVRRMYAYFERDSHVCK